MSQDFDEPFVVDAGRILRHARSEDGATRLDIKDTLGLGRGAVVQRIGGLVDAGLLESGDYVASTRGRAPVKYSFNTGAGCVLAATVGFTGFRVAITDLAGHTIAGVTHGLEVLKGPQIVLGEVVAAWRDLLAGHPIEPGLIWGAGVSLPGPVEFSSGRPIVPTSMPGWDEFPVREFIEDAIGVPCWVDNDVNMMALGELRGEKPGPPPNLLVVKVSAGIGGGLISGGRIHRGAQGGAGDIGHIPVSDDPAMLCVCGNVGCLGTVAGGQGIAFEGLRAAESGASRFLAAALAEKTEIDYHDVIAGAVAEDPQCLRILNSAGLTIGSTIATLVNFFNPSVVILGGSVSEGSELIAQRVREVVYGRCLPIATRELVIRTSRLGHNAGIIGVANMVVDELLAPSAFRIWYEAGSRSARPSLATLGRDPSADRNLERVS